MMELQARDGAGITHTAATQGGSVCWLQQREQLSKLRIKRA